MGSSSLGGFSLVGDLTTCLICGDMWRIASSFNSLVSPANRAVIFLLSGLEYMPIRNMLLILLSLFEMGQSLQMLPQPPRAK